MIKQAEPEDIPVIEEILGNAVDWMKEKEITNLWNQNNTKWSSLSGNYKIEDFYIYYLHHSPVACMAVTDYDAEYWPEIQKGESLFLHKLAVKKEARGSGISKEMIDYVKIIASAQKINGIRLDCNANRAKLRLIYERQGFHFIRKVMLKDGYEMALYSYNFNL